MSAEEEEAVLCVTELNSPQHLSEVVTQAILIGSLSLCVCVCLRVCVCVCVCVLHFVIAQRMIRFNISSFLFPKLKLWLRL